MKLKKGQNSQNKKWNKNFLISYKIKFYKILWINLREINFEKINGIRMFW